MQALAQPFTPAHRLHNKADFDRVYRDSRRFSDALFAIAVRPNGSRLPRLGLSTAARIIGCAVHRNRVKRLVRESFRHHQHELSGLDIVVNARSGARTADNASIVCSLEHLWQSVSKLCV